MAEPATDVPTFDAPPPAAAGHERRRSERTTAAIDGWMGGPGGRAGFASGRHVAVRDLSLHGAGLISDGPARVGERRWFLVNGGPLRLSTRMRVASCRPRPDGRYDIGGEFY